MDRHNSETTEDLKAMYNPEGSILRQSQQRMVEILTTIDTIARKHNISYWLEFGTLIGAIRHKGFIPWDDDIDIAILRSDYNKLLKALETELPEQFILQTSKNDKYFTHPYARVVDKKSKIKLVHKYLHQTKYQGLFVDIFPCDRGSALVKKYIDILYGRTYRRLHFSTNSKIEYAIACLLWLPCKIAIAISKFLYAIVAPKKFIYCYGFNYFKSLEHKTIDTTDILPTIDIEFEGYKFMCPRNYDKHLRSIYGDYMQIPPADKRRTHSTEIEFL